MDSTLVKLKRELRLILGRHEGRRQAITSRELSALTGADDRRVRLAIRELRAEGFPVLSSPIAPAGFYLPMSWLELDECLASLRSRLIEDARTRRDLKVHGARYLTPAYQVKLL